MRSSEIPDKNVFRALIQSTQHPGKLINRWLTDPNAHAATSVRLSAQFFHMRNQHAVDFSQTAKQLPNYRQAYAKLRTCY